METVTTTLSGAADAVTSANSGTAIDAFAAHWQRTGGSGGRYPSYLVPAGTWPKL